MDQWIWSIFTWMALGTLYSKVISRIGHDGLHLSKANLPFRCLKSPPKTLSHVKQIILPSPSFWSLTNTHTHTHTHTLTFTALAMTIYRTDSEEEALFRSYPCAVYYVQSPSSFSYSLSAEIRHTPAVPTWRSNVRDCKIVWHINVRARSREKVLPLKPKKA